jgi:hypothetical protein
MHADREKWWHAYIGLGNKPDPTEPFFLTKKHTKLKVMDRSWVISRSVSSIRSYGRKGTFLSHCLSHTHTQLLLSGCSALTLRLLDQEMHWHCIGFQVLVTKPAKRCSICRHQSMACEQAVVLLGQEEACGQRIWWSIWIPISAGAWLVLLSA